LQCIEIDPRAVELLEEKHPCLVIRHEDVLQVNYPKMAQEEGQPLVVIGNLPYYITSQILFALADASHFGAVRSATVTMQWEVAQRMVAPTRCKDYGILSVVFQLYADVHCHFKISPTVFYPQPKVDSALIGLHFLGPTALRKRLAGVNPSHLRRVLTTAFQQRRKTVRNSLKKLVKEICGGDAEKAQEILNSPPLPLPASVQQARDRGDEFAMAQELPADWASKRPEELSPGQFVELTRLLFGPVSGEIGESVSLGSKVWRKLKHGT
jgi:16S rRNA A1518/A1519 N6-dimethyltransferase RsmA/KsgA/DIM1 with predicted DNA glycosylase/AP lyase activity